MSRRIAVLGTGANGASIAADLVRAGLDVSLIDQWPEHVQAMRQRGLKIEMPGETLELPVRAYNLCDVCTFTEQFDIVLLVMKAYDSRWATQLIEPYLKSDGIVVGVQNGLTADIIADVVGPHRAMGCVIEVSSNMYDPGVVSRHSPPATSWFAVGALDARAKAREPEIRDVLSHSGTVEIMENIRAAKWMKLVSNSSTLVTTAVLGLSIQEALKLPGMRDLMLRAGQEALDLGGALGHPVLPIFGLTPEDMRQSNHMLDTMLDYLVAKFTLPHTKSTVLHDWVKGRHSEVDDVNGLVAKEAARLGRWATINRAVVEVAHRIEKGTLKPGPANLALLQELARQ